jgi:hypothetical protein
MSRFVHKGAKSLYKKLVAEASAAGLQAKMKNLPLFRFSNFDLNLNTHKPWSEMDLADLRDAARFGRPLNHIADFLMRSQPEALAKAREMGWHTGPTSRRERKKV